MLPDRSLRPQLLLKGVICQLLGSMITEASAFSEEKRSELPSWQQVSVLGAFLAGRNPGSSSPC